MQRLKDAKMYARFAWGLRSFLSHPITLDEARATTERRIAEREINFLGLVEWGIFGHPLTRISLVVDPSVDIADEAAVIDPMYDFLRRSSVGSDAAVGIWSQAGTLRVKRMRPVWTARGKLMPLHLAGGSRQRH